MGLTLLGHSVNGANVTGQPGRSRTSRKERRCNPLSGIGAFVVHEEPSTASALAEILRLQGFAVIAFTNPLEAMASALVEPPELLLSDIVMSRMPGFELALEIKMLFPKCKVLLFSGEPDTVDLLRDSLEFEQDLYVVPLP